MAVKDLTPERLRELLHYDPETGVFTWVGKNEKATAIRIGEQAGNVTEEGYIRICMDKTPYKAHRLAWMYCFGSFPSSILDHISGDRADNRIANLRLATRSLNSQNRRPETAKKRGKQPRLGVWPVGGNFVAQIGCTLAGVKRNLYLGTYPTEQQAQEVYNAAKVLIHPGAVVT